MINAAPFVWLAAGAVLMGTVIRIPDVPVATWLGLVFLVHATRTASVFPGLLFVWLAVYAGLLVGNRVSIPLSGPLYFGVVAALTVTAWLPFAADRLLVTRIGGWSSTLVFPLAWVAVEFLRAKYLPPATWGASAYTQYGNLPLMQLAAVTGIWGIAFLVAWGGAIVNYAWDEHFAWAAIRGIVVSYVAIASAILIAGSLRVAFAPANRPTMRVATLTYPKDVFIPGEITHVSEGRLSADERETLGVKVTRLQDSFLERSRREARAGARLVAWPEGNLLVFKEEEQAFLSRARALAADERVYLAMGMGVVQLGASKPFENMLVLVDPSGAIRFSYHKSKPVAGWEESIMVVGDGQLPIVPTADGRIAGAICFEADFPDFVRRIGQADADLWIVPANEWKGIERIHLAMAVFRAIENGVPMVRPASSGISAAIDPWGRVIASADDRVPGGATMIAQVPVGHVRTIYARIGDLFAWLCVAGIGVTIVAVLLASRLPRP
jgi:apolipoprotein N-acyltransferase